MAKLPSSAELFEKCDRVFFNYFGESHDLKKFILNQKSFSERVLEENQLECADKEAQAFTVTLKIPELRRKHESLKAEGGLSNPKALLLVVDPDQLKVPSLLSVSCISLKNTLLKATRNPPASAVPKSFDFEILEEERQDEEDSKAPEERMPTQRKRTVSESFSEIFRTAPEERNEEKKRSKSDFAGGSSSYTPRVEEDNILVPLNKASKRINLELGRMKAELKKLAARKLMILNYLSKQVSRNEERTRPFQAREDGVDISQLGAFLERLSDERHEDGEMPVEAAKGADLGQANMVKEGKTAEGLLQPVGQDIPPSLHALGMMAEEERHLDAIPDDLRCSVCGDPDPYEGNDMLNCEECLFATHQKCYGIEQIPEGPWFCRLCVEFRKKIKHLERGMQSPQKPHCALCLQPHDKPGGSVMLPLVVEGAGRHQDWAHLRCGIWVPESWNSGSEIRIDKKPFLARGKLQCCICKQKGGCPVQCEEPKCTKAMHVSCAFEAGLKRDHLEEGEGGNTRNIIFCPVHGKQQSSNRAVRRLQIMLNNLTSQRKSLRGGIPAWDPKYRKMFPQLLNPTLWEPGTFRTLREKACKNYVKVLGGEGLLSGTIKLSMELSKTLSHTVSVPQSNGSCQDPSSFWTGISSVNATDVQHLNRAFSMLPTDADRQDTLLCSECLLPEVPEEVMKGQMVSSATICTKSREFKTCVDCGLVCHLSCLLSYGTPLLHHSERFSNLSLLPEEGAKEGRHWEKDREFLCERCRAVRDESELKLEHTACILCDQLGGHLIRCVPPYAAESPWDPIGQWVHPRCVFWLTSSREGPSLKSSRSIVELARLVPPSSLFNRCCLCGLAKGGTLKCSKPNCPRRFHVSCGFANSCAFRVQAQGGGRVTVATGGPTCGLEFSKDSDSAVLKAVASSGAGVQLGVQLRRVSYCWEHVPRDKNVELPSPGFLKDVLRKAHAASFGLFVPYRLTGKELWELSVRGLGKTPAEATLGSERLDPWVTDAEYTSKDMSPKAESGGGGGEEGLGRSQNGPEVPAGAAGESVRSKRRSKLPKSKSRVRSSEAREEKGVLQEEIQVPPQASSGSPPSAKEPEESDDVCPVCFRSWDVQPSIGCDSCERWLHISHEGFSSLSEINTDMYFCKTFCGGKDRRRKMGLKVEEDPVITPILRVKPEPRKKSEHKNIEYFRNLSAKREAHIPGRKRGLFTSHTNIVFQSRSNPFPSSSFLKSQRERGEGGQKRKKRKVERMGLISEEDRLAEAIPQPPSSTPPSWSGQEDIEGVMNYNPHLPPASAPLAPPAAPGSFFLGPPPIGSPVGYVGRGSGMKNWLVEQSSLSPEAPPSGTRPRAPTHDISLPARHSEEGLGGDC